MKKLIPALLILLLPSASSALFGFGESPKKQPWLNSCYWHLNKALDEFGSKGFKTRDERLSFLRESCGKWFNENEKKLEKSVMTPKTHACCVVADHFDAIQANKDDGILFYGSFCSGD